MTTVISLAGRGRERSQREIRIEKPDDYDPRTYEIFRRGFQKGVNVRAACKMRVLGEYADYSGWGIFSGNSSRALWAQSVAGENAAYPDGEWTTRSRIWRDQMNFVRGMSHFLRTDPSAPEDLREKAETIGFQGGIFVYWFSVSCENGVSV